MIDVLTNFVSMPFIGAFIAIVAIVLSFIHSKNEIGF